MTTEESPPTTTRAQGAFSAVDPFAERLLLFRVSLSWHSRTEAMAQQHHQKGEAQQMAQCAVCVVLPPCHQSHLEQQQQFICATVAPMARGVSAYMAHCGTCCTYCTEHAPGSQTVVVSV